MVPGVGAGRAGQVGNGNAAWPGSGMLSQTLPLHVSPAHFSPLGQVVVLSFNTGMAFSWQYSTIIRTEPERPSLEPPDSDFAGTLQRAELFHVACKAPQTDKALRIMDHVRLRGVRTPGVFPDLRGLSGVGKRLDSVTRAMHSQLSQIPAAANPEARWDIVGHTPPELLTWGKS